MASTFPRRTRVTAAIALIVSLAGVAPPASAFCGFYVGKADAKLFNEASQVILARDGNRTVIGMRNDFQGELTDFALVVPVPVVLQKNQIHIGEAKIFEKAYLITLFQEVIEHGVAIHFVTTHGDYMEIDTEEDHALANRQWSAGTP